jgi:hypothetical protein
MYCGHLSRGDGLVTAVCRDNCSATSAKRINTVSKVPSHLIYAPCAIKCKHLVTVMSQTLILSNEMTSTGLTNIKIVRLHCSRFDTDNALLIERKDAENITGRCQLIVCNVILLCTVARSGGIISPEYECSCGEGTSRVCGSTIDLCERDVCATCVENTRTARDF